MPSFIRMSGMGSDLELSCPAKNAQMFRDRDAFFLTSSLSTKNSLKPTPRRIAPSAATTRAASAAPKATTVDILNSQESKRQRRPPQHCSEPIRHTNRESLICQDTGCPGRRYGLPQTIGTSGAQTSPKNYRRPTSAARSAWGRAPRWEITSAAAMLPQRPHSGRGRQRVSAAMKPAA
jgi:hypothetical protein